MSKPKIHALFEYLPLNISIHGEPPVPPPVKALVFVHGIYSGHETAFRSLADKLSEAGVNKTHEFAYFDYNFRRSIAETGADLAKMLIHYVGNEKSEVTLIGHSMGGLVCRLALLQRGDDLKFVKRLIMLGTPNHGTLHTGRLGWLTGATREASGVLWAQISRKAGIKQLTEIGKFLKPHLKADSQTQTLGVDYISIPATCFHEESGRAELILGEHSRKMVIAPLAMELLTAIYGEPIGLNRPHDGIVEEDSVFLGNRGAVTRNSERRQTCEKVPGCGPYLHVRHDDFLEHSHVTIQKSDKTAEIIASVLGEPDLETWRREFADSMGSGFSIEPGR